MSRFITACILLVLIMTLCIYALNSLNEHKDDLFASLDAIIDTALEGDLEKAGELSVAFNDQWTEFEKQHVRYIRKHQLDSITSSTARLSSLATKESKAEFMAELQSVRAQIYHLWDGELPIPRNLF